MSKAKIMIVDDEPDIIKGLTMRLKANGYDVISAMDGMRATTLAVRERPDLLILDVGMPAGSGHVVAERLRANTVTMHMPIIMLTARTADEDRMQALNNGVDRFLNKPFKPEELLEAIASCLSLSV